MASDPKDKKEFTSIIDLQKMQAENPDAAKDEAPEDPFAVNVMPATEQVDSFESIDQIGMMDHTSTDLNLVSSESPDDLTKLDQMPMSPSEEEPTEMTTAPLQEADFSKVKDYSESTRGKTDLEVKIHYPFHLKIFGTFGPYERDKLLLFITENPIGLSSADLDVQLQAGKVFFPRISEYAGIKLVQELRDSGLEFSLLPSDHGEGDGAAATGLRYHYESTGGTASAPIDIPILSATSMQKSFQEIDQVSIVQFVRTDMLEMENSPIIQEVIERMTEALKNKARLKGGNALLHFKQEITPLRLPSQYQISLKASVVKI